MFRFRPSLAALALALLVPVRGARASVSDDVAHRATAFSHSLSLLRRVLHFGHQREPGDERHLASQNDVVSHVISVSSRESTLELELAGGRTRVLSLRDGRVLVDGEVVGSYTSGGTLDRAWRRALADGADLDTRALLVALHSWRGPALGGAELAAKARLDEALRALVARTAPATPAPAVAAARAGRETTELEAGAPVAIRLEDLAALDTIGRQLQAFDETGGDVAEALRSTPVHLGGVTVAAGQKLAGNLVVYRGAADVYGEVTGSVITLFGDVTVYRGAVIGRDALSVGGRVLDRGGTVRGTMRMIAPADLAAADIGESARPAARAHAIRRPPSALDRVFSDVRDVVVAFVAFAMLGFGTVFFGRRHLEIVADTASHSFGRSFVVGLLGQLLLLPTFAMLIVGLVCTVVGILLLPFAAVAYVGAALVALAGGYLAVAHAIGETFTRRRMAHGAFVRAPHAYGYLFHGLVGLLGLWAAAALTAWMGPVVLVFRAAALIVTWVAATAGFGAVLLSRAGLRETFAGRQFGEMSDEYLWATPPATPTAARMKTDQR